MLIGWLYLVIGWLYLVVRRQVWIHSTCLVVVGYGLLCQLSILLVSGLWGMIQGSAAATVGAIVWLSQQ
jgi:hypothetical protein